MPAGFAVVDDKQLLDAIGAMGQVQSADPSFQPLVVTVAFEGFLAAVAARSWQPAHASRCSVEFCVAFGQELTQRLNINHRVRTTKLTPEELATLRSPPFAPFVDQSALQMFQ